MKRTLILVSAALVALVATGFAVGRGLDGVKSVRLVAGTFVTGTPSQFKTRSCTTSDNKTLVATEGVYTGTATGDADFTGSITLRARSLINSTDGIGVVSGALRIHVASGGDTVAHFDTVYKDGQIAGLASGHAQDPHAKLLANLSSAFSNGSTGVFNGKLGGGTSGGFAVELGPGRCEPSQAVKETSEARGILTAPSPTSITVANLTCSVPASLQSKVAGLLGVRVEIHCSASGTVNTLVKVEKK